LDFAPLPEAHPTYQPVRDAAAAEDVLECTGLGICAVQDGEVAGAPALETPQPVDLVGDVLSLLHVVVELSSLQTFSAEALGPEPFRRPLLVVADHVMGRIEDVLGGSVVLLEIYDFGLGVILLEVEDVPHVGSSKAVDALVVVS